jgi:reactive intermediate/imine deaminase
MARIEGRTDRTPTPVASYSQAVRVGSIVSVAGQAGFDPVTGQLAGPDVGAQTVQTFKNIEGALAACDATLDDVIRVDVYLATLSDFAAMNEEYASIFSQPYPTRTTVGVELPPGMKVEITVLAVRD